MSPALLIPKYVIYFEVVMVGFERFCMMERKLKESDQKEILIFCTFPCNFIRLHPIHVSKNNPIPLLKLQYLHLYLEWQQHKIENLRVVKDIKSYFNRQKQAFIQILIRQEDQGPRFHISYELPDGAEAAGLETTLLVEKF